MRSFTQADSVRRAFTLSELLFVIAIGVLLGGLLLIAISRIRETAAGVTSYNNLKTITLATVSCADTYSGRLPRPGDDFFPEDRLPADNIRTGYGPPFFHVLPFVEASSLYSESFSQEDNLYSSKRLRGNRCAFYQAPDDPTRDPASDSCSYAVNELLFAPPRDHHFRLYPADIWDGTANTIMYAEQYAHQHGTWGTGWPDPRMFKAYTEVDGERIPKDPPYQEPPRVGRDIFDGERPQSFRRSGLLVGVADGSVRHWNMAGSAKMFYETCTPDGREGAVGGNW
jgi:hypothetical protein